MIVTPQRKRYAMLIRLEGCGLKQVDQPRTEIWITNVMSHGRIVSTF
jgi:hypothetical protein